MTAPGSRRRPLSGWRVAVTRASHQASALSSALTRAGATPLEVPTIEIAPPGDGGAALAGALARLAEFGWVCFTSANAVSAVLESLGGPGPLRSARLAAVGRATAAALGEAGLSVALVPEAAEGASLAAAFGPAPSPPPAVLLPQAAGARPDLAAGLRASGYRVEEVEAYRTLPRPAEPALARELAGCRAITFASPSALRAFVSSYGRGALPPVVASIGPVTSEAARRLGIAVAAEAATASVEGIVAALGAYALAERAGD